MHHSKLLRHLWCTGLLSLYMFSLAANMRTQLHRGWGIDLRERTQAIELDACAEGEVVNFYGAHRLQLW